MILSTQLISVVEANLWYPRIPAPVLMGLWITMALQRRKENMVFTFLILAAKIRSENNPNIVYLQPHVLHSTICSCMALKNILERTFWVRSNFPEVVCRPSSLWDTSPIQLFESHCQNSQLYSYLWQVINRQMGISIPEMIANQIFFKLWVFELQGPKFQVERPSFERVMVSPYQHKIGFSTYSKMKFFPLLFWGQGIKVGRLPRVV